MLWLIALLFIGLFVMGQQTSASTPDDDLQKETDNVVDKIKDVVNKTDAKAAADAKLKAAADALAAKLSKCKGMAAGEKSYAGAKTHKALAYNDACSAYGWAEGKKSAADAAEAALMWCRKYSKGAPCKISKQGFENEFNPY
jgi:hypothetical protein